MLKPDELADIERDVAGMLARAPVTRGAAVDKQGRHGSRNAMASRPRRASCGPESPAREIIASAAELDANLLVMGAVSRSGLSHAHIGTTAEAVIDGVTCDVLVVKPRGFKSAVVRKGPKLPAGSK
ncbi:MAG TPA: universal stress protein [Pseudomonadales bacterium]